MAAASLILQFRCEDCYLIDNTLAEIEWIIKHNEEMSEEIRVRYSTLFYRQRHLILEWKKHQLRSVHQEAARAEVLSSLDNNSVRKRLNSTKNISIVLNSQYAASSILLIKR